MKVIKIALLVLTGSAVLFLRQAFGEDLTNQTPNLFKVTVTPEKIRTRVKEPFTVSVEVKNISNTNQQFTTMSCSWWENWQTDSRAIGLSGIRIECVSNYRVPIDLMPGETYKKELKLEVYEPVSTNKLSFQIGCNPLTEMDYAWASKEQKEKWKAVGMKVYWSNELQIELKKWWW